jgi:hypothetical protein
LDDERYVELAKSFNFGEDGELAAPLSAQYDSEIDNIANEYLFFKTRFVDEDSLASVREDVEEEAAYYAEQVQSFENLNELFANDRVLNFVLEAKGLDPSDDNKEALRVFFASDLSDESSDINLQENTRYREIVASFNFDQDGNLTRVDSSDIQSRRATIETLSNYFHQNLEEQAGDENAGVRLALYFQRMSSTINSAYDILADDALLEVFKTTYSLPDGFSNLDIDVQAELVERYMDLEDLADPEKRDKIVQRFTALYDIENAQTDTTLSLFSSGSSGISSDTLLAINQL